MFGVTAGGMAKRADVAQLLCNECWGFGVPAPPKTGRSHVVDEGHCRLCTVCLYQNLSTYTARLYIQNIYIYRQK